MPNKETYIMIREVLVRKDCPICKGEEYGCYDCNGEGWIEEWINFVDFINDMKCVIERRKGIM